jgi:lipoprotein-releasing system permease protein
MFELRTAFSYLVPKKGQLSVSVVGILAVIVIQAITWLVLVFFSTTEGFQNRWTDKIAGLLSPIRIVPTAAYYDSPVHLLDSYSSATGFITRRLSKKAEETHLPYNPSEDSALPPHLQQWYQQHGQDISPVHLLIERLQQKKILWRFSEATVTHLSFPSLLAYPEKSVSQYAFILGFDTFPLANLSSAIEFTQDEFSSLLSKLHNHPEGLTTPLRSFVHSLDKFDVLITKDIALPSKLLKITKGTLLKASITYDDEPILHLTLPSNEKASLPLLQSIPPVALPKPLTKESLFLLRIPSERATYSPLSYVQSVGYPLLLPKMARQQGIQLFDTGSFQAPGTESSKPLTIPFYVAGFFDPGILPVGGKLAITSRDAVIAIHPELSTQLPFVSSGIVIDSDMNALAHTEKELKRILGKSLSPFFVVERYDQYEMTRDVYQQLQSEKLLFRMLSLIIIAVACSNIFSMLFILAHDRRKEIAVMRALGASKSSITAIFLLAGLGIGLVGSLLGSALACLTLHYLPEILSFIGQIQGHPLLHPAIYGEIASQHVSLTTLLFTLGSVSIASAFAGMLAAMRACRINVSDSLKGGG